MGDEAAVGVEVPASSANLGPGYDVLAVAVDRRLAVRAVEAASRRVTTTGLDADAMPTGDDNLVWRALVSYCHWAGVPVPGVSLRAHNDIPLERGLGSSAAAAVAGLALGRAVTGVASRDQDLIDLAVDLEGHPENAAAAALGGLVVCHDGVVSRLEPASHLRPLLWVPGSRQSTHAARALLGETVSLADATATVGRAAAVLVGLAGVAAWDPRTMTDTVHEPPRFAAMPDSARLVGDLREAGVGACLSGAGPSVLGVVPAGDEGVLELAGGLTPTGWQLWPAAWDHGGAVIRAR